MKYMEEEENNTVYVTKPDDERARQQMLKLISLPQFVQRYAYFNAKVPKHYQTRVIAEKDDRISIIDKMMDIRIGANGCFIKQNPTHTSGATYYKKGRSSTRLTYWGNKKSQNFTDGSPHYGLTKEIAKKINPETAPLLDDRVIRQVGTKGMYGYIIAGNITSKEEAMEYYIRYSMRGVCIKQELAYRLWQFYSSTSDTYLYSIALRVAEDPNEMLEQFQDPASAKSISGIIDTFGSRLTQLALAAGETIDWVKPHFDAEAEAERLSRKGRRIEDLLNLWEGGPVLEANAPQSHYLNVLGQGDDLLQVTLDSDDFPF